MDPKVVFPRWRPRVPIMARIRLMDSIRAVKHDPPITCPRRPRKSDAQIMDEAAAYFHAHPDCTEMAVFGGSRERVRELADAYRTRFPNITVTEHTQTGRGFRPAL
jgi:hypothetical protein